MKKSLLALACAVLAIPVTAEADEPACRDITSQTAFTQEKRRCFEALTASGNYQEILDRIEPSSLGLTPQEGFFLGTAYFGLSNRTAAQSLQCLYSVRSKEHLESFLVERQNMYRSQHSFGTSDDMKYVYRATKELEALKTLKGCEESSYTIETMERFGRKYANERVRTIFFKGSTTTDPVTAK